MNIKSTREAFGNQISLLAEENKKIVVLTADLKKATCVDEFAKKFPDRFFQIGIAEANMIGISSGLSEYKLKVFITSFASFLTGRYDIIRCSIAYSKAPVIIVGTHGGLAIGKDGVTQMGLEDISLMNSLPNMIVLNPATYSEAFKIVKYLCDTDLKNPCYLRLGRQPIEDCLENYYNQNNYIFGKGIVIKEGEDITIFSTGSILPDIISVSNKIEKETNNTVKIVNISCIKPIDEDIIIESAKKSKLIVTVEDHSIIGGLGSIISNVLSNKYPAKVLKIGLNDIFPESGLPSHLYDKYGLSINKISERIINEMDK